MNIQTRSIEYEHGETTLDGLLFRGSDSDEPRPGILVAHAWGGRSDYEDGKARKLAELGYTSMSIDMYGKGRRGGNPEQNAALMQPLLDDRPLLQARMQTALETLRAQPEVEPGKVAAIGFCFGGLCVLDLARSGEALAGVVSFHGLFTAPGNTEGNTINTKILLLHGWDDPMATPDQVVALGQELSAMNADWQIHGYSNTMHAFTNPAANNPDFGTVYDASADTRSWQSMRNFLTEIFS